MPTNNSEPRTRTTYFSEIQGVAAYNLAVLGEGMGKV